MADRTGICEDCGSLFIAGSRGIIPKCCSSCSAARRKQYEKEWGVARPAREKAVRDLVCTDCKATFSWTVVQGPLPVRCKPCAKDRRRAATRERGRLVRLAAKAGDTRRHGVCIDCLTEFIAPSRGSLPRRCPGCTEAWNKVRHQFQASRKERSREYNLRTKYGMSPEDWQKMYDSQDGACAVCKRPDGTLVDGLHVDHCHSSGKVRGLLCHSCNTALGHLQEDPDTIRAAADYVEWHMLTEAMKVSREE